MATASVYSFETQIASHGYDFYKETSLNKVRDGEKEKLSSKRTTVPKNPTCMLVPFVQSMNTSMDGKHPDAFQEKFLGMCITPS